MILDGVASVASTSKHDSRVVETVESRCDQCMFEIMEKFESTNGFCILHSAGDHQMARARSIDLMEDVPSGR